MNKKEAKILIVDDIEDNRYTLERSLKRDGYDCLLYTSPSPRD